MLSILAIRIRNEPNVGHLPHVWGGLAKTCPVQLTAGYLTTEYRIVKNQLLYKQALLGNSLP